MVWLVSGWERLSVAMSKELTKTLIVAVSGGVDSIVLLDILVKKYIMTQKPRLQGLSLQDQLIELVVAHVDHGIRNDSVADAEFVTQLATSYDLSLHVKTLKLGPNASEELARHERYHFLHEIQQKYPNSQLVTAHHKNDVVETMIINLMRGTGWRGLCSLRDDQIRRPLLSVSKQDILAYAKHHKLTWHEDSTNQDTAYLRNMIRQRIMPRCSLDEWFELYRAQCTLRDKIELEIKTLTTTARYPFIMYPSDCALEVLQTLLKTTRPQTKRALHAIKTARPKTIYDVGNKTKLHFTNRDFQIEV